MLIMLKFNITLCYGLNITCSVRVEAVQAQKPTPKSTQNLPKIDRFLDGFLIDDGSLFHLPHRCYTDATQILTDSSRKAFFKSKRFVEAKR